MIAFIFLHFFDNLHMIYNDLYTWFNLVYLDKVLKYGKLAAEIFILIICVCFVIPLSVLVWVQINNFLYNKTTFERFSH